MSGFDTLYRQPATQRAQHEWEEVGLGHSKTSFSAAPSLSVRPMGTDVNILVRYITRADERHELRTRLYRAILELLHTRNIPKPNLAGSSLSTQDLVISAQT
jgi:hypothetical protein